MKLDADLDKLMKEQRAKQYEMEGVKAVKAADIKVRACLGLSWLPGLCISAGMCHVLHTVKKLS